MSDFVDSDNRSTSRTQGQMLLGATGFALSMALLLTTATQLRPAAIPVGIGEILLAAWIVWQLVVVLLNPPTLRSNDIAVYLAVFWFTFSIILVIALAISYQQGQWDERGAAHDGFALAFSAVFSILLASHLVSRRQIESLLWKLIWMCGVIMALLLLLAARRDTFFGIDPWYAAIRFTGWAKNPNQIGLLLVSFPFLAMWLGQWSMENKRKRIVVAASVLLIAGLLSQSDALYVGWVAGGLVVVVFYWANLLTRKGLSSTTAFWSVVGVPGLILVMVLWSATMILGEVTDALVQMYELGGQGSARFQMWSHGIAAFADSPLLGHGPGAFAGVTAPFSGFEAHNTFIDIATKSGLVGLLLYSSILLALHVQLLRTNQYFLLAALISVTIFSIFHYVLRQPVYWTVVVICMRMAWDSRAIAESVQTRPIFTSRERPDQDAGLHVT